MTHQRIKKTLCRINEYYGQHSRKVLLLLVLIFTLVGTARAQEPTNRKLYGEAIRSIAWIVNDKYRGSGFLLNKNLRFVVTNAHVVTDSERVDVFFPVTDRKGNVIQDREYYRKYWVPLEAQGFYSSGRVTVIDKENDLAIIQVDWIPHDIREINTYRTCTDMMDSGTNRVHILGNPGGFPLWRWSSGHLGKCGNTIDVESTIFPGNSGGPVLDDDGNLVGIAVKSELHMNAEAVPAERLAEMAKKIERVRITSFANRASFLIHYRFRCGDGEQWEASSVRPGQVRVHWCYPGRLDFPVEPAIRYDYLTDDKVTYRERPLEAYSRHVLPEDAHNMISYQHDAREYHFEIRGREILLVDSEN